VDTEAINVQAVWERPAPPPSVAAGMHRFALTPAPARFGFGRGAADSPTGACASSTPSAPATPRPGGVGGRGFGERLQPGNYSVRLTVDGQTLTQPVTVLQDPRTPKQSR
jgi:hypothetical protein